MARALGHQKTIDCRVAELLDACETGDVERVVQILDHDMVLTADVAQWTIRRLVPTVRRVWSGWGGQPGACGLHCAATQGHAAVVAALLERGADANKGTRHGVTPLHLACFGGHAAIVELLLDPPRLMRNCGLTRTAADPNYCCRDLFGKSGPAPLHLCCGSPAVHDDRSDDEGVNSVARADARGASCAALLLRYGAAPNLVDLSTYRTPLHYAAVQHRPRVCAVLIHAGVWLQALDAAGETPLSLTRGRQRSPATLDCSLAAHQRDGSAADADGPSSEGELAVLRELLWLPAVRLLWLGHLKHGTALWGAASGDSSSGGSSSDAADGSQPVAVNASPLQLLTRDVVRLIASFVVVAHSPPTGVTKVELPDGSSYMGYPIASSTGTADEAAVRGLTLDDDPVELDAVQEAEEGLAAGFAELALAVRTMHESALE